MNGVERADSRGSGSHVLHATTSMWCFRILQGVPAYREYSIKSVILLFVQRLVRGYKEPVLTKTITMPHFERFASILREILKFGPRYGLIKIFEYFTD